MINIENLAQEGNRNKFLLGHYKVMDDYIGGSMAANTGLAFDRFRRRLYVSGVAGMIKIYSEDFRHLGDFPFASSQGIAYDSVMDTIIGWTGTSTLSTYAVEGVLLQSQTITLFGITSGTICYDEVNDCLYCGTTGTNIKKLIRSTGYNWAYDSDITVANFYDGLTYDMNTNSIYYHASTLKIRNVALDGSLIVEFDRPKFMATTVESCAFNPLRNTLYMNSPAFYHGGQNDGNRVWEVYPHYYY